MMDVITKVMGIADKVLPDNDAKRETMARLEEGWRGAMVESDKGQVQQNVEDSRSNDRYRSYPRPTAMWICVIALAYNSIIYPMLVWLCLNMGWIAPPPLPGEATYTALMGMLGLGTMRSHDIWRGKR